MLDWRARRPVESEPTMTGTLGIPVPLRLDSIAC